MRKRKETSEENNRQNPGDFVSSLIKPKKTNKKTSKKSSSRNKSDVANKSKKYSLTPKGIMYKALCEALKQNVKVEEFDIFIKKMLQGLSLLSSGGNNEDLFSPDFNCFFTTVVQTMNLCGVLREMLEDNGIEVDIQEILGGKKDDNNRDEDSEDEGE